MAWAMRRNAGRDVSDEVRQVQNRKVRQLYAMLDGVSCRAAAVRRYFGEEGVQPCGVCDLCLAPPESVDATVAAQKALAAVHRLGGRFGRGRLIDHLLGKTRDVHESEAALSTYGVGQEISQAAWRDLIDQLLFDGLLKEDPNDGRPLIGLGDAEGVKGVYRGERRIAVRKQPEPAAKATRRKRRGGEDMTVEPANAALFEALRAWRRDQAHEQHVPPYVIFADRTLYDIARLRPRNASELLLANGVGDSKAQRYGGAVLKIVREN